MEPAHLISWVSVAMTAEVAILAVLAIGIVVQWVAL